MADSFHIPQIGAKGVSPDIGKLGPSVRQSDSDAPSFKDILAGAVGEVQRLQNEADTAIRQLVSGEIKDVTEAMVAVEKADVSFQTMMAVRNKIVAAYEEVMRMQV